MPEKQKSREPLTRKCVSRLSKNHFTFNTMHPLRFGVHCHLSRASNKIKKAENLLRENACRGSQKSSLHFRHNAPLAVWGALSPAACIEQNKKADSLLRENACRGSRPGLPDEIRTHDLQSRSLMRYPAVPRVVTFSLLKRKSNQKEKIFPPSHI